MIQLRPYPVGKSFALTFVDDTDLSTRENTEPVYDLLAKRGFWGTKTVWPSRAKRTSSFRRSDERDDIQEGSGSTLEDPDYAAFILQLKDRGFEIALHGVAAGNSTREEIETGLAYFRRVIGRMPTINAFHRTNLENLYCGIHKLDSRLFRLIERLVDHSEYEGHQPGTPSFWGDIAHDTFRYVRLPFHTIDEVNTLKVNPSMPFRDPKRPHVRRWFAASDGADVVRFNRLLSESSVHRLARQRGVCVIYTHFAKGFARRRSGVHALDEAFVRTIDRVTSLPGAWFAAASDVLDRLEAVRGVSLQHEGKRIVLENTGERPVHALVMRVPPGMEVFTREGRSLNTDDGTVLVPDLQPFASEELTTNQAGRQLIAASMPEIARRERTSIEYRNYVGLLRGWYRDRLHYLQAQSAH